MTEASIDVLTNVSQRRVEASESKEATCHTTQAKTEFHSQLVRSDRATAADGILFLSLWYGR